MRSLIVLIVLGIVLGGVVLVVDIAPRRSDVFGCIDRILLVDWIGELDVTVFVLTPLGVDIFAVLESWYSWLPPGSHVKLNGFDR